MEIIILVLAPVLFILTLIMIVRIIVSAIVGKIASVRNETILMHNKKVKDEISKEFQEISFELNELSKEHIDGIQKSIETGKLTTLEAIEKLKEIRVIVLKTVAEKYYKYYNIERTIPKTNTWIYPGKGESLIEKEKKQLTANVLGVIDEKIAQWQSQIPNVKSIVPIPKQYPIISFQDKKEIFENDIIEDNGFLKIRRKASHNYNNHKYTIEVTHSGLNLFKVITSSEKYITERKLEIFLKEIRPKWLAKQGTDEAHEMSKKLDEILVSALKTKNVTVQPKGIKPFNQELTAVFETILEKSQYPFDFSKKIDLHYNPENSILVVEYQLPSIENIPNLKEVKYIKGEIVNHFLSDIASSTLFEEVQYKITLRTIYELFINDTQNILEAITFNGWCNTLNKARGVRDDICILTLQASKDEFMAINLEKVEPRICFKNLKGISGGKLDGLTPIQPIMSINRDDKRFVSSYDVVNDMNSSTNLAAMDWEDFEHLIREIFEKEFSTEGSEVRVTQASKDGGVDAVVFDPDPIKGGKIVIQAKRYTNVVGVSAVRDLYGTVMNEGANKGILVTTADYGPDSYEFAKGKPLTLLNGSNLLHLLEKHGHKARINIQEARSDKVNQTQ